MAGPALVSVVVFLYGPIVASLGLSFTNVPVLGGPWRFVGWRNYGDLVGDPDFAMAARNTLFYAALLIPAELIPPLGLALLLHRTAGSRLAPAWRAALFLPTILAYSVAGVIWSWMLNPLVGAANDVLAWFALPPSRWHTAPDLALACVAAVAFWKTFGLNVLLWLAALLAIPRDVREAASLDGARFWPRLWYIELPLISPTAFFILLTTLFMVMDDVVGVIDALTHGGPAGRSGNLVFDLWRRGMDFFLFGQAAAATVLIVLGVLAISGIQARLLGRRVTYD
jgi:multiple sugar transport system permease protein/sn-glycerol 3-phosphate transport system permease protein